MQEKKTDRLRIKDWGKEDRPREKLMSIGRKSLSNAELLAILIGSGNDKESAIELSQRILNRFDNKLDQLMNCNIDYLCHEFRGIGEAKAITIIAALELSRRLSFSNDEVQVISNSNDIYEYIKSDLVGNDKEEAWIIYVNAGNKVLQKKKICDGGLSHCTFDIRLTIREAISLLASGIIMVHNHPSGNPRPSSLDKEITHKMIGSCQLCDIQVLDHLIVGNDGYYSFFDEGILL